AAAMLRKSAMEPQGLRTPKGTRRTPTHRGSRAKRWARRGGGSLRGSEKMLAEGSKRGRARRHAPRPASPQRGRVATAVGKRHRQGFRFPRRAGSQTARAFASHAARPAAGRAGRPPKIGTSRPPRAVCFLGTPALPLRTGRRSAIPEGRPRGDDARAAAPLARSVGFSGAGRGVGGEGSAAAGSASHPEPRLRVRQLPQPPPVAVLPNQPPRLLERCPV